MKRYMISLAVILLAGCGGSSGGLNTENEERGYIGNPYSDGTGHYAGYDWAEQTGGDCNGHSASFNEGCEEYYRQIGDQ